MNEGPVNQNDVVDTTDCLEAVSVFRGWKNIFFVVIFICLLLSQIAFWLVDLGVIRAPATSEAAVSAPGAGQPAEPTVADANEAGGTGKGGRGLASGLVGKLNFGHLARTIELTNGVLIVTAVLYSLMMFFSLMVSLVGRLGGINHISRAFILSLIMVVLIIPWQKVLGSSVVGVVWTSDELLRWLAAKGESPWSLAVHYLRFTGYWLIVMLLLILSQSRSARWSKAILRRLEII
jgi:hypothetical protein